MAVYRRSSRPRYVLLLLVLTAITLLTLDERGDGTGTFNKVKGWVTDTIAPVQSTVGDTLQPVGDAGDQLGADLAGAVKYGHEIGLRTRICATSWPRSPETTCGPRTRSARTRP